MFNGYEGIAAYDKAAKLSVVVDNTYDVNSDEETSIASEIFKALAAYVAPNASI